MTRFHLMYNAQISVSLSKEFGKTDFTGPHILISSLQSSNYLAFYPFTSLTVVHVIVYLPVFDYGMMVFDYI